MKLKYELPERQELLLRGKLYDKEIMYCVPYNLTRLHSYVVGYVVICRDCYFVVQEDDVLLEQTIESGDEYTAEVLPSSGALELKRGGMSYQIANYTTDLFERFGMIARILNELSEGFTPRVVSDDKEKRCENCGRSFLRGTRICPHCFDRKASFKRLFAIAARNKMMYLASFLLFFVSAGVTLVLPEVEKRIMDDVLLGGAKENLQTLLYIYVATIAGMTLLRTGIGIVRELIMNFAGASLARDLRAMLYDKIQSLSLGYIETKRTGALMHNINGDTRRINDFIRFIVSMGLNDVVLIVSASAIMLVMNWQLALMVILPLPIISVILTKAIKKIQRMFHAQWHRLDVLDSLLNDVLNGIRVVKAFGQEKREIARFNADAEKVRDITIKNDKFFFTLFPFMRMLFGFGSYFIILYGGSLVLDMKLSLGELMQYNVYASYLYMNIDWLSIMPRRINEALTSAQRIFEIMDQEPEVAEAPKVTEKQIEGQVSLKNVTFGYHSHIPVLRHINIDVAKGEMIGLVGHSGSGKSTFINLVMRLYEVDEGSVSIDGIDVRDYPQELLKSQIGVVLQEPFLFSGTIFENIRYSKPGASADEVIQAAKIANAHDFITKFADGYDTKVGERGQRLSGGERQRISIARAVLSDPRILILDEATASVDTETERQIQDALGKLVKGRTTFAIAHRLSTLKNADRILVLDKGKLIELDTHDNLMKKQGKYYSLVKAQLDMHRVEAPKGDGEE